MKKFIVCAILLCSIAVLAAEFVFADNGKAFYTIVVPEKTSGFEEQAAKDLQYFFSKMSGAEFKIVKESAAPATDEFGMKVEALIAARQAARKEKNWAEADRIRDEIQAMGVILTDTKAGVTWKKA